MTLIKTLTMCIILYILALKPCHSKTSPLDFKSYMKEVGEKNTVFESILIDAHKLRYKKNQERPSNDLSLDLKSIYVFNLDNKHSDPQSNIALNKLFPKTGTEISLSYTDSHNARLQTGHSQLGLSLSQDIAQNAFGKATHLLEKLLDKEIAIEHYQVIESYEDYLATVATLYYKWVKDYVDLKLAQSSYKENQKLLKNIKSRKRKSIAKDIDVKKVQLQILSKKEQLITFQEKYQKSYAHIKATLFSKKDPQVHPIKTITLDTLPKKDQLSQFLTNSRSIRLLNEIKNKSAVSLEQSIEALLPSLQVNAAYLLDSNVSGLKNKEDVIQAGFSAHIPFKNLQKKAEKEIAALQYKQSKINTINSKAVLKRQIKNGYTELYKQNELIKQAKEKIRLAKAILKYEEENYSYGKVTLNDYIQAVNGLDIARFNEIKQETNYKITYIEWKRLTDSLVREKELSVD